MSEKPCTSCMLNAGAVLALSACEQFAKAKIDCKKLEEQLLAGEITQLQIVDKIVEVVEDPDVREDMKQIRRMMTGEAKPPASVS